MSASSFARNASPVKYVFDSADGSLDHPRPFAAGLYDDQSIDYFAPSRGPVETLLFSLGYDANAVGAIVGWAADRGGKLDRCPVIERHHVAQVETAIAAGKAPAVPADGPFEPTAEEQAWNARTSPLASSNYDVAWERRLGLIPSRVKANRQTRQYSR